jgi:MinD-like ATPase involved in chromosome partitioning or flagellar assembly
MPLLMQGGNWRTALRQTESGALLLPYGQMDSGDALALADHAWRDPGLLLRPMREILADPSVLLIVDTPPGPSTGLAAILPLTDLLLTVLLADAASVALIPAIEQGRAYGAASASIVARQGMAFALNQVDPRSRLSRATAEAARRHLGSKLLGMVYRDENVPEAIATQQFIGTHCPASRAAQDIAGLARTIAAHLAAGERQQHQTMTTLAAGAFP